MVDHDTIAERVTRPAPEAHRSKSHIRMVANARFEVRGASGFEETVREAVTWMRGQNGVIPASALLGSPFEVGGGGDLPAQAVALDFDGGRVWAAIADVADSELAGRTWVTELTVGQSGGRVHFGTRLINVTRGEDRPFFRSLPKVTRAIIERLDAYADNEELRTTAKRVHSETELYDFIAVLDDAARTLPVLAIADGVTRPIVGDPSQIARRVAGASHVYSLSSEASWLLTREIGKAHSVFDGAARIYGPGFSSYESDPFDQQLILPRRLGDDSERADAVVTTLLANSVRGRGQDEYPRFAAIRQAVVARAIQARQGTSTDAELRALYEAENQRLEQETKDLKSELNQWLDDFDVERTALQRQLAEFGQDLAGLRSQNASLRTALAGGQVKVPHRPLETFEQFEDWARENLSARIWISPKAYKAIRKDTQFAEPQRIGEALLALDEQFIAMKDNPGAERRRAYEKKLLELECEDQPCFSNKANVKSYPEYSVSYGGDRYWCSDHIKHGGGTDARRFFRIYYCWNEEDQILLVGHLPSHLDNKQTN